MGSIYCITFLNNVSKPYYFEKKIKCKIFQYFQEESNTEAYTNRSLLGNFDWNDAANFLVGPNLPSRVRFQNAKTTTVNFDTKFPPYQKF